MNQKLRYWVYRAMDAGDNVLYVGMTRKLTERGMQHERQSTWAKLADRYILRGPYACEADARYAEQCLIADLNPIFNVSRPTPRLRGVAREGVDAA